MQHSEHFYEVKSYYDSGTWNAARARRAVVRGWITGDEYREITGEAYGEG